ncbi:MAG: hypothetical protein ABL876_08005 [Chitinophagaceae bacterium]
MSKLEPLNSNVIFEAVTSNDQGGTIIIPDSIGPTQALGKVVAIPENPEFAQAYPRVTVGARIFYNIKEVRVLGKYCSIAAKEILAVERPE